MATIASFPEVIERVEGRIDEVMTQRLDRGALAESLEAALERRGAVALGPGLGLDGEAKAVCERLLLDFEGPVVADADAISHFAGRPEALQRARGPRVLTPHSGELGRLLGKTSAEVEADRFTAAREAAQRSGATVVLKGRHSIVATGDRLRVCAGGNAVLATAGAGDVLTGMLAALCCVAPVQEAAAAAVHLHAMSGDRWREGIGADRGMMAREIAEGVPDAIAALMDDPPPR
jgi:NAD(P)H-hydrate epimerase